MAKKKTATVKGKTGESRVFELFKQHGIEAEWMPYGHEADFVLSDGRYIDVKYSSPYMRQYDKRMWIFNLNHRGKKQTLIDFFIFVCWKDGTDGIYIIPAKLCSGKTTTISERQMERGKFDYFKDNFDLLKPIQK